MTVRQLTSDGSSMRFRHGAGLPDIVSSDSVRNHVRPVSPARPRSVPVLEPVPEPGRADRRARTGPAARAHPVGHPHARELRRAERGVGRGADSVGHPGPGQPSYEQRGGRHRGGGQPCGRWRGGGRCRAAAGRGSTGREAEPHVGPDRRGHARQRRTADERHAAPDERRPAAGSEPVGAARRAGADAGAAVAVRPAAGAADTVWPAAPAVRTTSASGNASAIRFCAERPATTAAVRTAAAVRAAATGIPAARSRAIRISAARISAVRIPAARQSAARISTARISTAAAWHRSARLHTDPWSLRRPAPGPA
jgi:hypothetical protein